MEITILSTTMLVVKSETVHAAAVPLAAAEALAVTNAEATVSVTESVSVTVT